jgi:hypothetical protein
LARDRCAKVRNGGGPREQDRKRAHQISCFVDIQAKARTTGARKYATEQPHWLATALGYQRRVSGFNTGTMAPNPGYIKHTTTADIVVTSSNKGALHELNYFLHLVTLTA